MISSLGRAQALEFRLDCVYIGWEFPSLFARELDHEARALFERWRNLSGAFSGASVFLRLEFGRVCG